MHQKWDYSDCSDRRVFPSKIVGFELMSIKDKQRSMERMLHRTCIMQECLDGALIILWEWRADDGLLMISCRQSSFNTAHGLHRIVQEGGDCGKGQHQYYHGSNELRHRCQNLLLRSTIDVIRSEVRTRSKLVEEEVMCVVVHISPGACWKYLRTFCECPSRSLLHVLYYNSIHYWTNLVMTSRKSSLVSYEWLTFHVYCTRHVVPY